VIRRSGAPGEPAKRYEVADPDCELVFVSHGGRREIEKPVALGLGASTGEKVASCRSFEIRVRRVKHRCNRARCKTAVKGVKGCSHEVMKCGLEREVAGGDRPARTRVAAASGLGLAVAALLLAACANRSASPGVASAGSSTSTTVGGGIAGNSGGPPTPAQLQALTRFASCARKHGLPNFPDPPYSNGELNKLGFRKYSPRMEAATKACHAEALAAGVVQTQAELQQHLAQLLKISECMRAHGITDFPDPNANGGFVESTSAANQPGYAAAAKKCAGPPGAAAQGG
jgi:hypothetical protein